MHRAPVREVSLKKAAVAASQVRVPGLEKGAADRVKVERAPAPEKGTDREPVAAAEAVRGPETDRDPLKVAGPLKAQAVAILTTAAAMVPAPGAPVD